MESTTRTTGRVEEKAGQAALIPIPMKVFWATVTERVNKALVAQYTQVYLAEVYRGDRRNKEVEEVIDGCFDATIKALKKRGCAPRYPVTRRPW